jgi:predicted house-cleaning noncanonical NTP pyrophosphatase (MazG superfamily)
MKLVRDNIPEIILNDGQIPVYHIAEDHEFKQELFKKVVEELEEFREDPCAEEAADLIEVVYSLAEAHGFSIHDIIETGMAKSQIVGGFKRRVILDKIIT